MALFFQIANPGKVITKPEVMVDSLKSSDLGGASEEEIWEVVNKLPHGTSVSVKDTFGKIFLDGEDTLMAIPHSSTDYLVLAAHLPDDTFMVIPESAEYFRKALERVEKVGIFLDHPILAIVNPTSQDAEAFCWLQDVSYEGAEVHFYYSHKAKPLELIFHSETKEISVKWRLLEKMPYEVD